MLDEATKAALEEKVAKGEELTPEEQTALEEYEANPPEGEGPPSPQGESIEEKLANLESEILTLKEDSKGKMNEIINLRDKNRALDLELQNAKPSPSGKSILEGREPTDYLSIDDARALQQENFNLLLSESDKQRNRMSEKFARLQYKDYDEVVGKFHELAKANPVLERLAIFDEDPAEFMYQRGLLHPDIQKDIKAGTRKEVISKITGARPHIPKGGGGAGPSEMTAERAAELSPEEWKNLPDAVKVKILKETGSG